MRNCLYIKKNGETCGCQLKKNQILCSKHSNNKNQKGGGDEMAYPNESMLGISAISLGHFNEIFSRIFR
jgi:hypothetical protein